ncbi:FAD-binding protein [Adlercreutzia equolifaciens]|uniref:FAD-dependent oxidoreductase n=1 Tax=Adlercreutzia equolifaciens TaxID=446660 RepID=UPI0023AF8613|nr:FAD-dependent oxidoreductase [Adlercreutzia equolifaciens]MDE8702855.1 FAD-binding protein [Adlercreutzia equolifaciens]
MTTNVSRRDLFKFGGLAALGVAGAAGLAGCGQPRVSNGASGEAALASTGGNGPAFLNAPEPITEFAETHDFDVVVVGAGESGLSAVHTALEAGARVACVQNINAAQTTGNMAASIDLSQTDEAAVQACVSFINWKSDYRSNRDLVNIWAHHSQEALAWWADEAAQGGVESKPHEAVLTYNGYDIHLHANTYFHVEGNHNAAATVIAERLAAAGAEFFYNMPCVQLQAADGAVTGAICQDADGAHHLFTAAKGVILACGDYSSNTEMLEYYAPDTKGFSLFTDFRDGSALCAGMWAGAIMTPHTHTKMIHGEPAAVRLEMPFLFVDQEGNRFMDETCCRMGYMNNFARPYLAKAGFEDSTAAKFFSLVPANWEDYYEDWKAESPYDISQYNGDNKVDPEKWISADTIEGLAEAMNAYAAENQWNLTNIDPAALAETVNRYNELCAAGRDEDFGKSAKYLVPIEGGPYYAIPRGSNKLPAILGGLVVDGNHQCLNGEFEPIQGLYAVGNASGQFFGGVDYPMDIEGLSIGRAITSGYYTGKLVAGL